MFPFPEPVSDRQSTEPCHETCFFFSYLHIVVSCCNSGTRKTCFSDIMCNFVISDLYSATLLCISCIMSYQQGSFSCGALEHSLEWQRCRRPRSYQYHTHTHTDGEVLTFWGSHSPGVFTKISGFSVSQVHFGLGPNSEGRGRG